MMKRNIVISATLLAIGALVTTIAALRVVSLGIALDATGGDGSAGGPVLLVLCLGLVIVTTGAGFGLAAVSEFLTVRRNLDS